MSHSLTLQLPPEVYAPLIAIAKDRDSTPEEVAATWLAHMASRQQLPLAETNRPENQRGADPLEKWIGVFSSNTPGWSDRHDELIGEALYKEMHRESDHAT